MIVRVQLKDPDSLDEFAGDAARKHVRETTSGLTQDEIDDLIDTRKAAAVSLIHSMWVEHGEYYVIEFDTVEKTARVLTVREANQL